MLQCQQSMANGWHPDGDRSERAEGGPVYYDWRRTLLNIALSNGAELLGEVIEKKIENVGILTLVYFRDPEGNIIEIQSWEK
jgi:hypothetical protein